MDEAQISASVAEALDEVGVILDRIEFRQFPGEHWVIGYVGTEFLPAAQSLAGAIEAKISEQSDDARDLEYVATFRPSPVPSDSEELVRRSGGLFSSSVDQLVQLLEARSRTSDALPSLRYVDDPRSSLTAIAATRHHLVYGRRGVGKTALLLEAKRGAEAQGHIVAWVNAHVIRDLELADALSSICTSALAAVLAFGGTSGGAAFNAVGELLDELRSANKPPHAGHIRTRMNQVLRPILRAGIGRLFIFVDDFYFFDLDTQAGLLDHLSGMLRDCDGWLKVASIERLTRPYEPSSKSGLEVPHDATVMNLDVTLEDPQAAQYFLESVLASYTSAVGLRGPAQVAKREALGRLVMGSGGVPRDYLNLFANSIVVARESRSDAREVGKEDVAIAAGRTARSKKSDLEQDVSSNLAGQLLGALSALTDEVRGAGFTYFRVNMAQDRRPGYSLLGQLVDLRFSHLIQQSLSDQHKADTKYEAYSLDLSEFTDVRLKRGLNVLDLEDGAWTWRLTGKANSGQRLSGTQLRDRLRQSPIVDVDSLAR